MYILRQQLLQGKVRSLEMQQLILLEWDWRKQIERLVKVWLLRQDRHGISAAPPREYALRPRPWYAPAHHPPPLQRALALRTRAAAAG